MFSFLQFLLKIGVGLFSLLCSAVISDVLLKTFVTQTLVFSFIWYLGFLLEPLLYFGYHLVEVISNYTSSLERLYMEEIQNGIFATFFYDVSAFITTTFLYLEHPWVVKVHLLPVFGHVVLVLTKQLQNITQKSAPRLDSVIN